MREPMRRFFATFDVSRRFLLVLGALVLLVGHTRLCLYFEPPAAFWNAVPLRSGDFDTHFGQASRFADAMRGWGKIWSYDPSLLAGHPAGVLFDCDNNFWNLWTYALHSLGLPKALAFNLLVVAAPLTIPALAWVGARLLRFSAAQALLFSAIGSLLWFFDSQTHYFWWIGMLAWPFGSYVALVPLGLFYRFTRSPRAVTAVLSALTLALSLLVHPYTFFVLVVPMGVMCVRAWPGMTRPFRAAVPAIAVFAVIANS
ncbi:MAG TPA: hypothetical protein VK524_33715, partial [Polyangiaceae bacterium]|nr:hypothetical protein [Polyangiaceae bacterium]